MTPWDITKGAHKAADEILQGTPAQCNKKDETITKKYQLYHSSFLKYHQQNTNEETEQGSTGHR